MGLDLVDGCSAPLGMPFVEPVVPVSREHVLMEVPHVLVAGRLVVLAR